VVAKPPLPDGYELPAAINGWHHAPESNKNGHAWYAADEETAVAVYSGFGSVRVSVTDERCDGLEQPDTDVTPPTELELSDLARTGDVGRRDLEWNDDVWLLADPALLDRETGDMFRRTLRVVTDRLTDGDTNYPFDQLEDVGQRGEWIERCLESEEIVDPSEVRGGGVRGVTDRQQDLDSF